jgi:hypothetical protein
MFVDLEVSQVHMMWVWHACQIQDARPKDRGSGKLSSDPMNVDLASLLDPTNMGLLMQIIILISHCLRYVFLLTFLNMAEAQYVIIFNPLFIYFFDFCVVRKKNFFSLAHS